MRIRRPAVMVHRRRWKQQQIAGLYREGLLTLKDLPLAFDGQIDDEALHPQGPVDDEVERTPLLDGGHARDQEDIEGVARQQGVELFRLLFCIEDMAENSAWVKKSAWAIVKTHLGNALSGA